MSQQPQSAADHKATPPDLDRQATERDADLSRYGVVKVPHISYEWGGYRYSNAADAIAAARRGAK